MNILMLNYQNKKMLEKERRLTREHLQVFNRYLFGFIIIRSALVSSEKPYFGLVFRSSAMELWMCYYQFALSACNFTGTYMVEFRAESSSADSSRSH